MAVENPDKSGYVRLTEAVIGEAAADEIYDLNTPFDDRVEKTKEVVERAIRNIPPEEIFNSYTPHEEE